MNTLLKWLEWEHAAGRDWGWRWIEQSQHLQQEERDRVFREFIDGKPISILRGWNPLRENSYG